MQLDHCIQAYSLVYHEISYSIYHWQAWVKVCKAMTCPAHTSLSGIHKFSCIMLFAGLHFQFDLKASLYIGADLLDNWVWVLNWDQAFPLIYAAPVFTMQSLRVQAARGFSYQSWMASFSLNVSNHIVLYDHCLQLYTHSQCCSQP